MKKVQFRAVRLVSAGAVGLLAAVGGCSADGSGRVAGHEIGLSVPRLSQPELFTVDQAVAQLAESLARWRVQCVAVNPPRAGVIHLEIAVPTDSASAELRHSAQKLAARLRAAAPLLLDAAGLAVPETGDRRTPLNLGMQLSVTPDSGIFLEAQITGDEVPVWWELLEITDSPTAAAGRRNMD